MSSLVLNVEQQPPILDTDIAGDILADYDVEIDLDETTDEDELAAVIPGYDGLLVHAGVPVTRRVIEAGADLRVIARCGIGVDNVDLEAAAEHDVTVVHHPSYSVDEVASHALALLLSSYRAIPHFDRATRSGQWEWAGGAPIGRLADATLGLLGFGAIGRRVAIQVQGLGIDVLAADPYVDDAVMRRHNVTPATFPDLCDAVDMLSIHAELTPETEGLVDADALSRLADDAVLVNTGRGPIIDIDALVEVLEDDGLRFVGLDVADPEPLPGDHPLFAFDNVVVTPHVGWYSEASRRDLSNGIARDVGLALVGEEPHNRVV